MSLSEKMSGRSARGGGLVQFGPTSALPHSGTEGRRLECQQLDRIARQVSGGAG